MAIRGKKFRHRGHSYRVIDVGQGRYMMQPWIESRRPHGYCVIDFRVILGDDFSQTFDFWVYAPQLKGEHDRRFDGLTTLAEALAAGASLIERAIARLRGTT